MLGGIDNHIFFEGLGGFAILLLIIVPLLKWTFPTSPSKKAEKLERKRIKQDLRRLKKL